MSAIFIASTGEHRGKTTLSLGIYAALQKRFNSVGFIKPVGQKQVEPESGVFVDKDAVLFRDVFGLQDPWKEMSPILIPPGFTKKFLDGNGHEKDFLSDIGAAFEKLSRKHPFTIVEGTGHVGVGSIIGCSNARVARLLKTDVVLIAEAGLGSSFDELSLSLSLCEKWGVRVKGVILNRVLDEKRDMIETYFPKALARLGIPLLGSVPYLPFLSQPCMRDFEKLFETRLLSGKEHLFRQFENLKLVAGSLESYLEKINLEELIITPATREDILQAYIQKHIENEDLEGSSTNSLRGGGIILTGAHPPTERVLGEIRQANLPSLYAPLCSFEVMKKISLFTSKIRKEETEKIARAISLVEANVNIDLLTSS